MWPGRLAGDTAAAIPATAGGTVALMPCPGTGRRWTGCYTTLAAYDEMGTIVRV